MIFVIEQVNSTYAELRHMFDSNTMIKSKLEGLTKSYERLLANINEGVVVSFPFGSNSVSLMPKGVSVIGVPSRSVT